MAIRFQCGACSQPIEVDDEWGMKAVACPYCRKTITAPTRSTLPDLSGIPTAAPLDTGRDVVDLAAPAARSYAARGSNSNPSAVAAFILACTTLVLWLLSMMIAAAHSLDLEQLQRDWQQDGGGSASQMQAMMEYVQAQGGFPRWLVAMTLLQILAMTACPAAIILGLLALRRTGRRVLAVMAVASSGFVAAFFCLNLLAAFGGLGLCR